MNPRNLVVTHHSALRNRALLAFVAFVLIAGGWFLYELGMNQAGFSRIESVAVQSDLRSENRRLNKLNKELSEQIAALKMAAKIDREAYRQVEIELGVLQATIQEQQEDIEFYKGIVNENDGTGLRIQDFEIAKGFGDREYDIRLVLAQAFRSDRQVSGRIELVIEGVQGGKSVRLSMADAAAGEADGKPLRYSFRYFQDLRTQLELPENFVAERVHVIVRPEGKSSKTVEEFFIWDAKTG